tara:strand:+ start:174 stop:743 length:570 start_codon:yes stop_codon:yes gene_type:complete
MANRSKEAERQNRALQSILEGKPVEKDYVQVGYEGKKDKGLGGKTRESELSEVMQSVRMPWFCPSCKKAMKKKLDDKFWRLMGHCFDCQVEVENKLRITGEYEKYAQLKVLENQKSHLKDLRESIKEFEKSGGKQVWLNQVGVAAPDVEEEKWEMGKEKFETMVENAHEHLENLQNKLDEKEKQLTGAE